MITQEEITANNKLISEFMYPNIQKEIDNGDIVVENGLFAKACIVAKNYEALRYHLSWDWLMPVIYKIIRLGDNDDEVFIYYRRSPIESALRLILLERTWEHVVDFIKWYNQDKKSDV